jgi:hypothetical protein
MLIHQFDVVTAFLNSKLREAIYVKQPPGFVVPGYEDYVYLLNKALYGLKQADMNGRKNSDAAWKL